VQPLLDALAGPEPPAWPDVAARVEDLLTVAVGLLQVDGVGLMLVDDAETARPAGASDDLALILEKAQTDTGQGPGIDSLRTGATVAVHDLAEHAEYDRLWQRLRETGVRAVLSSPIRFDDQVLGNFNAATLTPHEWTSRQIRSNEAYAGVVGLALSMTSQALAADRRVGRLQEKLAISSPLPSEDQLR
jgi:transcriptional regulator with GAF, ATPase, and Fis domain